jgi:hypothetical protein
MNKKIKLFFPGTHIDSDYDEFSKAELKEMTKSVCKPCWELKFCPYGPLVESFPLPPITRRAQIDYINYLRKCIKDRRLGDGRLLDTKTEKYFNETITSFRAEEYPLKVEDELIFMSCSYFGHLCPVFFSAEPFTETEDGRNQGRNIPRPILIRVVRRDDATCQECGTKLLDKDIEIDHIIPLSKGGATSESNLRVLCSECNKKKTNDPDILLNERSKVKNRKKYY